eukprot:TRINITY_DN11078_c0_g1_i1.p1 TRINITY_DN11078_c0_g1~~TRINITY_DN11078_c0_g1_i1.p1  ORF type:complete len:458 (-),score=86.53 TRINITY_DN11078_c0_g1_i1:145-1446(-)
MLVDKRVQTRHSMAEVKHNSRAEHLRLHQRVSSEPTIKQTVSQFPTMDYLKPKDVTKMVKEYIIGEQIGKGCYAKVKEGIHCKSLKRVAIKIFDSNKLKKISGGENSFNREVSILSTLNHVNIVQLHDYWIDQSKAKMFIILEFMSCGTLQDLIEKQYRSGSRIPMVQIRQLFSHLINGLDYLHHQDIIHKDIKPDNLLLNEDGVLKICDFGVAERIDETFGEWSDVIDSPNSHGLSSSRDLHKHGWGGGSLAFLPPESLIGETEPKATTKNDVWSAGIILFMCATGRFPFEKTSMYDLVENITKGSYKIPDYFHQNLKDLIKNMLSLDPSQRFSISEIRKHSFMTMELPKEPFVPLTRIRSAFGYDSKTIETMVKQIVLRNKKIAEVEEEFPTELEKEKQERIKEKKGRRKSAPNNRRKVTNQKSRSRCNIM